MQIITKKNLIATAAQRYAAAYLRRNQWPTDRDYTAEKQIHAKLKALPIGAPINVVENEIAAIVGHNRLTHNRCHQCGVDRDVTVTFSHEKHHALDVTPICPSCLEEALKLAVGIN